MAGKYSISDLINVAFGVKSPVTIGQKQQSPGISFNGIRVRDGVVSETMTWMGTPIIFPFHLKGGIYKKYDNAGNLVDEQLEDFLMPAATLVDFSRTKNKPKTTILGHGTVKEMYGFDDWQIRVRGLCLTDNSRAVAKTAQEQKEMLLKYDNLCSAIGVIGSLFAERDIYQISMSDISFRQMEGQPEVVSFEFSAESDLPFELIL